MINKTALMIFKFGEIFGEIFGEFCILGKIEEIFGALSFFFLRFFVLNTWSHCSKVCAWKKIGSTPVLTILLSSYYNSLIRLSVCLHVQILTPPKLMEEFHKTFRD